MPEDDKGDARRSPRRGGSSRSGLPFEGLDSVEREVLSDVPGEGTSSVRPSGARPSLSRTGSRSVSRHATSRSSLSRKQSRTPSGGVMLPPPPDEAVTEIDTSGNLLGLLDSPDVAEVSQSVAPAALPEASLTPDGRPPSPPQTEWLPAAPRLELTPEEHRARGLERMLVITVIVMATLLVVSAAALLVRELRIRNLTSDARAAASKGGAEAPLTLAPVEIWPSPPARDGAVGSSPASESEGWPSEDPELPIVALRPTPGAPSGAERSLRGRRVPFMEGLAQPRTEPALSVEHLRALSRCPGAILIEGYASEGDDTSARTALARQRSLEIHSRLVTLGVRKSRLQVFAIPTGPPEVVLRCQPR